MVRSQVFLTRGWSTDLIPMVAEAMATEAHAYLHFSRNSVPHADFYRPADTPQVSQKAYQTDCKSELSGLRHEHFWLTQSVFSMNQPLKLAEKRGRGGGEIANCSVYIRQRFRRWLRLSFGIIYFNAFGHTFTPLSVYDYF